MAEFLVEKPVAIQYKYESEIEKNRNRIWRYQKYAFLILLGNIFTAETGEMSNAHLVYSTVRASTAVILKETNESPVKLIETKAPELKI